LEDQIRRLETELVRKSAELADARVRLMVSIDTVADLERAMRVA
jgi:hypothetical protein